MYKYLFFFSFLLPSSSISSISTEKPQPTLYIINVPQRPAVEMVHQSMKRNRDLFFLPLILYDRYTARTSEEKESGYITILKSGGDGWWAIYSSSRFLIGTSFSLSRPIFIVLFLFL